MTFLQSYQTYTEGITEAPAEFHWGASLVILASVIGRNRWIENPLPMYPNLFVVLVGESGFARKTTSLRLARDLLFSLFTQDPEAPSDSYEKPVLWLPGISSYEGFSSEMRDHEEKYGFANVIITLEEIASLLLKSKQDATKNLISGFTELYDCGPIRRRTMKDKFTIEKPFVSVLSGSTKEWLFNYMHTADVIGGFGNRFLYIFAKSAKEMPFAIPPDQKLKNNALQKLQEIRNFASKPQPMAFSDDAKGIFAEFYSVFRKTASAHAAEMPTLKRLEEHIKKLSMLYSLNLLQNDISGEAMSKACLVGQDILNWTRVLFSDFGDSLDVKIEKRILSVIEKRGPCSRRVLQQLSRVNGSVGASQFRRVFEDMLRNGAIAASTLEGKQLYGFPQLL